MSSRSNLKLVESVAFERREGALWGEESGFAHSLHHSISLPHTTSTELAAYFLQEFSAKGQIVLDPFCGSGTIGLESNLHGRVAYMSDIHPLAMRVTRAKLDPADITEVTLKLQMCNVRRPINISQFNQAFKAFYDLDTFRELVNLKVYLKDNYDRVGRFVEFLAMSLLHGHTAGFFSVYTSPQLSLTYEEQEVLNIKRGQTPDYRAVLPRLLRKAAAVLRDGIPSSTRQLQTRNQFSLTDARDLNFLGSSSVDLILTTPPMPGGSDPYERMWLRSWFSGIPTQNLLNQDLSTLDEWREFMNGSLLEMARVARPGARVVLDLREVKSGRESYLLDEVLRDDVKVNLSRFWDCEAIIVNTPKHAQIKHKERDVEKASQSNRVLVLRRR